MRTSEQERNSKIVCSRRGVGCCDCQYSTGHIISYHTRHSNDDRYRGASVASDFENRHENRKRVVILVLGLRISNLKKIFLFVYYFTLLTGGRNIPTPCQIAIQPVRHASERKNSSRIKVTFTLQVGIEQGNKNRDR